MMSLVKRSQLLKFLLYLALLALTINSSRSLKKKTERQEFDVFASKNYTHLQNFDAIRSYVDKKKYHFYTLPNKLQVLVIIDSQAKGSSAGISVNSGVMKEGKIFGLAHFTEHMLFLGSKKYSQPTYFVDFVTQFNGKFNGFTDFDTTGFFFKVNPDHFEKGMDIFSRFFIDPLFDPKYISKEINSVNSEFERNIQLDKKRREQVLHQSADENSHFHRFTTGNTKSIWDYSIHHKIDLEAQVKNYYNSQYRADNMQLIVVGNKEVEYYQKVINDTFSQVPAHEEPYNWVDNAAKPFNLHKEGRFIFYQTISNHQELDIHLVLPDLFEQLPDNFGLYFKTLINYRGKNSLLDILRKRGLAARLKCGLKKIYKGTHMLKIHLFLSNKGMDRLEQVLTIVFKYLRYLKNTNSNEKLYNFIKRYYDIRFLFMKTKSEIMKYIKKMCQIVRKYPKKYLFSQHFVLHNYNKEALDKFSSYFNIDNAVIMLGDKNFDGREKSYSEIVEETGKIMHHRERWYGTKYSIHKIRQEFIDKINLADNNHIKKEYEHKYKFLQSYKLPDTISLIRSCKKEDRLLCLKEFHSDEWDLSPQKISEGADHELWHKRDRTYLIAKVNVFNKFILPYNVKDVAYATKIRLITYAINHRFRHFFYDEKLKQNKFEIKSNNNGFSVRIFSFGESIFELSNSFFSKLAKLQFKKNQFNLIKDEMRKDIESQLDLVPQLKAIVNFFTLVLRDYHHFSLILKELSVLTLDEFNTFLQEISKQSYIKSFVHGYIERGKAKELFEGAVHKHFGLKSESPVSVLKYKDYKNTHADLSGYFIFREQLSKSYNINHAILNFYQIGHDNIKNIILAHMIKSLCGNIYFTELRIKEQLGYTTKGKIFAEGNYLYYLIVIQGSTATPDKMDVRIENVVELMRKKIEQTDEIKFIKYIRATEKLLGKNDISLNKRTFRLWEEIVTKRGYFNIDEDIKKVTKSLSIKEVMEFFNTIFGRTLSKLSIQEYSAKVEKPPQKVEIIKGIKPELVKNKEYFRLRNRFLAALSGDLHN